MNFDSMMPRDPFADDPDDPASLFDDDDDEFQPLSEEERRQVIEELLLVGQFRRVLEPRGINGVWFICQDCDDVHYYDWDIMAANMEASLAGELSPVHEPSMHPDPDAYASWDYCLGYLDGMEHA